MTFSLIPPAAPTLGGGLDPRTMALLAAGLGMLEKAGPSTTPVSLGQALGYGGMQGLNTYILMRQLQQQQGKAAQLRRMRELQMKQLGLEIEQAETQPEQIQKLYAIDAESSGPSDSGGMPGASINLPIGPIPTTPEIPSPEPMPLSTMPQPWAGATITPDDQLARTGVATTPSIEVLGSSLQAMRDEMAEFQRKATTQLGTMTPAVKAAYEARLKARESKIAAMEKAVERAEARTHPFTKETGLDPLDPKNAPAYTNWLKKKTEFAPQQQINVGVEMYDKTGAVKRAETVHEMKKSARQAARIARNIGYLAGALEGYGGGPITQAQAGIGRLFPESEWGKIASIDDLAKSIVGKSFQDIRQEGTGQVSDFESKTFISVFPTLAATPKGRSIIRAFAEKTARRELIAADVYEAMAQKGAVSEVKWEEEVNRLMGPMFTESDWAFIRQQTGVPGGTMRRLD